MIKRRTDSARNINSLDFERTKIYKVACFIIRDKHNINIARRFPIFIVQSNFSERSKVYPLRKEKRCSMLRDIPVLAKAYWASNGCCMFYIIYTTHAYRILGPTFCAVRHLIMKWAEL